MKKHKFIKLILIVFLFIIIIYCGWELYVYNSKIVNVSPYKEFQINLSHTIIWDNNTKESIYVKNKDGQYIDVYVHLSSDKKSIIINPPIGGFTPGKKYYITILPKIHMENYKINSKIITNFNVMKDTIQSISKEKKDPKPGDIIGISGNFMGYKYDHYGIYIGNNKVIHFCSTNGKAEDTQIQETSMEPYFKRGKYFILNVVSTSKFSPEETLKRAKEKLGEKNYDLLQNNCEDFALWCKTDNCRSYQIDKLSEAQIVQIKQFMLLGINLQ